MGRVGAGGQLLVFCRDREQQRFSAQEEQDEGWDLDTTLAAMKGVHPQDLAH